MSLESISRVIIKEQQITDKLSHQISVSKNEESVYLLVKMGGISIERVFPNNPLGMEKLLETQGKFDTEESIKQYLGLGEINV